MTDGEKLLNRLKKHRDQVKKEVDQLREDPYGNDWSDGRAARMREELRWLEALIRTTED